MNKLRKLSHIYTVKFYYRIRFFWTISTPPGYLERCGKLQNHSKVAPSALCKCEYNIFPKTWLSTNWHFADLSLLATNIITGSWKQSITQPHLSPPKKLPPSQDKIFVQIGQIYFNLDAHYSLPLVVL